MSLSHRRGNAYRVSRPHHDLRIFVALEPCPSSSAPQYHSNPLRATVVRAPRAARSARRTPPLQAFLCRIFRPCGANRFTISCYPQLALWAITLRPSGATHLPYLATHGSRRGYHLAPLRGYSFTVPCYPRLAPGLPSCAPPGLTIASGSPTHGWRRGLPSYAAPRLVLAVARHPQPRQGR